MNKFEVFAKLIVPAFFLIVWALNQIFNKETPATPARGNRPVGPPGGRPAVPPKRSEEDRAFAAADPKSDVWTSPSDPRNKSVNLAGDDEVLILSSETVRRPPPANPRTQSTPPANRPRQARRTKGNGTETGRGDLDKPQRLGGNISQSVNQTIRQTPLEAAPTQVFVAHRRSFVRPRVATAAAATLLVAAAAGSSFFLGQQLGARGTANVRTVVLTAGPEHTDPGLVAMLRGRRSWPSQNRRAVAP